jgi:hypothetical protein
VLLARAGLCAAITSPVSSDHNASEVRNLLMSMRKRPKAKQGSRQERVRNESGKTKFQSTLRVLRKNIFNFFQKRVPI